MWESRWASLKLKLRECMNSWGGQTKQEVGDGREGEDGEDAGPRAATKQVVELTGEQKEMGGMELSLGRGARKEGLFAVMLPT